MATRQKRTLYVVATSHLDTQWRWTFQDTINRHLPRTLRDNFALFEKFPHYRFSFEGAFRYMLTKEYYPEDFETLKHWVAEGRWNVCGASIDAGDVNTVSPESIIRHALYGNGFFKREFGKVSRDIFLPDCFGFGWALPSIAAHCGLKGFSTSKLEWGSSRGIPFNLGFWQGVDGNGIVATINPGQYSFGITEDVSRDEKWLARIEENGARCGAYVDFKYFGLGDTGGGPDDASVEWLEKAITGDGPIHVVSAAADELCRQLTPPQIAKLPRHNDEFLLIEHGVGTYTSNGAMKKLNRRNEHLADAAERIAVAADWLGGMRYPAEKLSEAWIRFLANQMHDILPGTCIPEAYHFSWNDEYVSLNQFASVIESAVAACSKSLDTRLRGTPIVVYNPLGATRRDLVTVLLKPPAAGLFPRILAPDGSEAPSQARGISSGVLEVIFEADLPAVALKVYELRWMPQRFNAPSELQVSSSSIENAAYRIELDTNGDIARLYDKRARREMLSAPIRLELRDHSPKEWPAWTIEHKDVSGPARSHVHGPAVVRATEKGPLRASMEFARAHEGSEFVQTISLRCGSDLVEVETRIRWQTPGTLLKVAFPLSVANDKAVYDLGLGVIERETNQPRLYEVPAQQWVDLMARDGGHGVAILSDCKYGWDKPDDHTLRMTLLHTPRMTGFQCHLGGANFVDYFREQGELDFGNHVMRFAIISHPSDWRDHGIDEISARFNQPMVAFETARHEGTRGREWSFARLDGVGVALRTLKKAEDSEEIIVRFHETQGRSHSAVAFSLAADIVTAREVNGMEEEIGAARIDGGRLIFDLMPWQPRAFALRPIRADQQVVPPRCTHLTLPFNVDAVSPNSNRCDGDLDGRGHSLPSEQLPEKIDSDGIPFGIGPRGYRERNSLRCEGQTIPLPAGEFDSLYLLAAAVEDTEATFIVDESEHRFLIHGYAGRIGSWDDRVVNGRYVSTVEEMHPAFVKQSTIAWTCSHLHSRSSNADEVYVRCYLFKYRIPLGVGGSRLVLPNEPRVLLFAATLVSNDHHVVVLTPREMLDAVSFHA